MSELQEGQILLTNVRIGFPKLWKPEAVKNDPNARPRYGCQAYLPKEDVATKARIDKEIRKIVKEKLKNVMPKSKDLCIKDGDGDDGDEITAGNWVLSINRQESQGRPQVLDRDRSPLLAEDAKIYGGCRVNILLSLYVPKGWKKIAASLEIVQFWADDEPFGASRPSPDVMPTDDRDFDV